MPARARPLLTALAAVAAAIPAVALAHGSPATRARPATIANGTPVRGTGTGGASVTTSGPVAGPVAPVTTATTPATTPAPTGPPRHGTPLRPIGPPACPSVAPRSIRLSHTPGANLTLVPGAPESAVLCRYNGLPEPAGAHIAGAGAAGFTLLGEGAVTGASARALAAAFDALAALPPGVEAFACPADLADIATVTFSYADGAPADPVTVELSGCRDSQNGHLLRVGYPAAVDRLTRSSARFIRAHEATLMGTVSGPSVGLSVEVDTANGEATALAHDLRHGHFRLLVSAGDDTLLLVRHATGRHPVTVLRRRLRLTGGHARRLHLRLQRR